MSPKEVAMSTELQSKSTLVIYATVRAIRFARKVMRCLTQGWIQWDRKQLEKKKSSFYSFKYLNENNSHSPDCGDDCFRPSFFHAVNVLEENSQYQRTEAKRLSVVSDNSSQTISEGLDGGILKTLNTKILPSITSNIKILGCLTSNTKKFSETLKLIQM